MIEKRSDKPIWRRIALPASLVLNLFLVALIGGHLLKRELNASKPGASLMSMAFANAENSLSRPDAAAFGAVIHRDTARYADAARQLTQSREELERRITAEPFDQAAVEQAFETWQTCWNKFIDNFRGTVIEALSQISPEGRQKLVIQRRTATIGKPIP